VERINAFSSGPTHSIKKARNNRLRLISLPILKLRMMIETMDLGLLKRKEQEKEMKLALYYHSKDK